MENSDGARGIQLGLSEGLLENHKHEDDEDIASKIFSSKLSPDSIGAVLRPNGNGRLGGQLSGIIEIEEDEKEYEDDDSLYNDLEINDERDEWGFTSSNKPKRWLKRKGLKRLLSRRLKKPMKATTNAVKKDIVTFLCCLAFPIILALVTCPRTGGGINEDARLIFITLFTVMMWFFRPFKVPIA